MVSKLDLSFYRIFKLDKPVSNYPFEIFMGHGIAGPLGRA